MKIAARRSGLRAGCARAMDTLKISDALSETIRSSSELEFGVHHGLFNLTQLSHFLKPLIQARLGREVRVATITMALSRYQRAVPKNFRTRQARFRLENLSVQNDLAVVTVEKTKETHRVVQQLYAGMLRQKNYLTVTEGQNQITLIFARSDLDQVERHLGRGLLSKNSSVAAICLSFPKEYIRTPGFLYLVLQQVTLQGINVVELSSTATQLILYLDRKDVRLAFDTLYQRFVA